MAEVFMETTQKNGGTQTWNSKSTTTKETGAGERGGRKDQPRNELLLGGEQCCIGCLKQKIKKKNRQRSWHRANEHKMAAKNPMGVPRRIKGKLSLKQCEGLQKGFLD